MTSMGKREYTIDAIEVNGLNIAKVIIDSHYEERHSEHINDELILNLVKRLDGRREIPESQDNEGYSYFVTMLHYESKQFRLIWLLEDGAIYIGVINAYRDDRKG